MPCSTKCGSCRCGSIDNAHGMFDKMPREMQMRIRIVGLEIIDGGCQRSQLSNATNIKSLFNSDCHENMKISHLRIDGVGGAPVAHRWRPGGRAVTGWRPGGRAVADQKKTREPEWRPGTERRAGAAGRWGPQAAAEGGGRKERRRPGRRAVGGGRELSGELGAAGGGRRERQRLGRGVASGGRRGEATAGERSGGRRGEATAGGDGSQGPATTGEEKRPAGPETGPAVARDQKKTLERAASGGCRGRIDRSDRPVSPIPCG
ncbi:uncharacterized protein LOC131860181 [Cryptomeria japonica]|uniref:uncharacterized protein LOC131860181 n=1 Tax=Cryptomeria japonica TaxID=3369 RepID=UPI0027DA9C02|nr:uncharacterized protein LOC131860181 [Cryptomeria japonica]